MKDIDKELSTILRKVVLFDEKDKLETELIENIKELFKESVPAETLVMPMLTEIVEKYGLECPSSSNCGNGGTLSEHGCDGTDEDCARTCPVPVQCEFCYCEPKSKFNLKNDLEKLLDASKHSA